MLLLIVLLGVFGHLQSAQAGSRLKVFIDCSGTDMIGEP
jgi:hypothetical protein